MAKKGEFPTRAAWIWPFFRGSTGVIRPAWRDLFSTEIPATADVARELCRLGDALYWRYKLVEILTKNYTTVAKVKWGPARAEWRSSCIKFKRSGRRDAPRAVKWWSWWDKWCWRGWIWTDGVELACSYWTAWEDWFRSTGTSQRKWRATCESTHLIPWSTWTLLRHAPSVKMFLTFGCTRVGFLGMWTFMIANVFIAQILVHLLTVLSLMIYLVLYLPIQSLSSVQ